MRTKMRLRGRSITAAIVILVAFLFFIWPGPGRLWYGTGFGEEQGPDNSAHISVVQYQRTLWDWLQLLGVPLAVVGAAGWLNNVQASRETRREVVRERDAILDTYLSRMADIVLHEKIEVPGGKGRKQLREDARNVAQAQTSTALRRLDSSRTGILVRFLVDSELVEYIELDHADLSSTDLSKALLKRIRLRGAIMRGVTLRDAI